MKKFKSRLHIGYLEGWVSISINSLLFLAKFIVGRRLGSVAMVADAWHSLSDSLTSILVILSFHFSFRPADDRHHFGHGRFEAIGSVIIATLLAVVGFNFVLESFHRLLHRQGIVYTTIAILIFLISAVIKEGLALFSFWLGKKIDSPSLIADAWHHRSDAVASALIVLGAFGSQRFWWVDGFLGLTVSALILLAVASIFRRSISYLLGESPSEKLEKEVRESILNTDNRLSSVHHLHLHEYGEHKEITVHVRLPADMNLEEAHEIATRIEHKLREKLKLEATIHLEPRPIGTKDHEKEVTKSEDK